MYVEVNGIFVSYDSQKWNIKWILIHIQALIKFSKGFLSLKDFILPDCETEVGTPNYFTFTVNMDTTLWSFQLPPKSDLLVCSGTGEDATLRLYLTNNFNILRIPYCISRLPTVNICTPAGRRLSRP